MEESKPHFIVPEKILLKFIQVYIRGEPFFRQEAFEGTTHSGLLEKTVEESGIIPVITGPVDDDTGVFASGEDYELVGAGTMFYNGLEISLYGLSPYNLGPSKKHLEELKLKGYIPKGIKFVIKEEINGRQTNCIDA